MPHLTKTDTALFNVKRHTITHDKIIGKQGLITESSKSVARQSAVSIRISSMHAKSTVMPFSARDVRDVAKRNGASKYKRDPSKDYAQ